MSGEDSRTLFIGNLGSGVTEDILYELFLQVGPIDHVNIPMDKVSNQPKNFGFICFKDECSVPYAYYLFSNVKLFGKSINVQTRRNTQRIPPVIEVGVHSLDPDFNKDVIGNFNSTCNSTPVSYQSSQQMNYQPQPLMQFPTPLMATPPPLLNVSYVNYNNGFQGFGTTPPPAVDTNSINMFKNLHANYSHSYNDNWNNYATNYQSHDGHNSYGRQDTHEGNYRSGRSNSYNDDSRSSYRSGRYDTQDDYRSRRQNEHRSSRDQDHYRNDSYDSRRSTSRENFGSKKNEWYHTNRH